MNEVSLTSWAKTVSENQIKYDFFSRDQEDQPLLNEVSIESKYGMDTIFLKGEGTKKIYKLIQQGLDSSYTHILGPINLVNKNIWISVSNIHSKNSAALRPTLDKIYQIIGSQFPQFNQLNEEIDKTLIYFGNKKKLNYFSENTKTNSSSKCNYNFESINLVDRIKLLKKPVVEDPIISIPKHEIDFSALEAFAKSLKPLEPVEDPLEKLSRMGIFKFLEEQIVEDDSTRKKYWLSYLQKKINRFKSSRPNPLPCTGCWGVKQNKNCLRSDQIEKITKDLSELPKTDSRFLIEYEEGDWADWQDYPREKWSSKANTVRELWGPIFLKQDKQSDDYENGFSSSVITADQAIGRVIGFSCSDLNSPLSGVYFVKQRCDSTSISITLFAKEGKLSEFKEWLTSIGILPLVEQMPFSFDDYLTKNIDKAGLYTPAAFYDSQRGIFGSIVSENIERLRKVLTEYHYRVDNSFSYAFNNICNSQTGVAPFNLPD